MDLSDREYAPTPPLPPEKHETSSMKTKEKASGSSCCVSSATFSSEEDLLRSEQTQQHRGWRPTIQLSTRACFAFIANRLDQLKTCFQRHRYISMWWWETICCIMALGALLATVATIRAHENEPLPTWRYGLTVNAIISAYTIVLKAAAGLVLAEGISHLKWISVAKTQSLSAFVAHDEASRGPLGALKLLWRYKHRSQQRKHPMPWVSSLGAAVTILVLLLDPFSQQIVRTYACEKLVIGENGTIPRTNVLNEDDQLLYSVEALGRDVSNYIFSAIVTEGTRSAVNSGLFASRKSEINFDCRTGSCQFADNYTTVAYCSHCTDTTNELIYHQWDEIGINGTWTQFTNVSLPVGYTNVTMTRNSSRIFRPVLVSHISLYSQSLEISMIRWDEWGVYPIRGKPIRGYRCRFYPCIRTLKASVSIGRLEEEVLEETTNFDFVGQLLSESGGDSSITSVADLHCLDHEDQRQTLKRLGYQFDGTTRWLPYEVYLFNGTLKQSFFQQATVRNPCNRMSSEQNLDLCNGTFMTEKALGIVPEKRIYNFWSNSMKSLGEMFWDMFAGAELREIPLATPRYYGSQALAVLRGAGSGQGNLEDVQGVMRNISDSLTTYVRQTGDRRFSDPAVGKMYKASTCIQISWLWIVFPTAIVALLLIFFIWMVLYSRFSQSQLRTQWENQSTNPPIHDFKSSASTFLFHGFDGESLNSLKDVGASNEENELEKRAKEVTVKFFATDQGWKLSSVDL